MSIKDFPSLSGMDLVIFLSLRQLADLFGIGSGHTTWAFGAFDDLKDFSCWASLSLCQHAGTLMVSLLIVPRLGCLHIS